MYASFIVSYIVRIIIILTLISSSGTCAKKQNYTEEHDPSTEISKRNEQHFIRPKNNETNVETSKTIQTFTNNDTHSESTKNRLSNFGTRGNESFHVDLTYVTTEETMRHLIPSRVTNSSGKNGVIRRKKRCILAMMAMGGVAVAGSMLRPPRRRRPTPPPPPPPPKTTTTKKPTTTTTTTTEEPTTTTTTKKPTTTTTTTTTKKPTTTTTTKKPTTTTTTKKPTTTTTTKKPTTTTTTKKPTTTTTTKKPTTTTTTKKPTTTTTTKKPTTTTTTKKPTTTTTTKKPTTTTTTKKPTTTTTTKKPTTTTTTKKPTTTTTTKKPTTTTTTKKPTTTTTTKKPTTTTTTKKPTTTTTKKPTTTTTVKPTPTTTTTTRKPTTPEPTTLKPTTTTTKKPAPMTTPATTTPKSSATTTPSSQTKTTTPSIILPPISPSVPHMPGKASRGKIDIGGGKDSGTIVIEGFPKYDVKNAIIVMKFVKKTLYAGILIIEFVHPITNEIIQVPWKGGDEYVNPVTRDVYIIFVDSTGKTLLIRKGPESSIYPKQSFGNNTIPDVQFLYNINITLIVEKYKKISIQKRWGSLVIAGRPKYDLSRAIIIMKREKRIDSDGILFLQFVHPVTGQKIRVPFEGGDEYVEIKTLRVFVIFVDAQGQTLLIFKSTDRSVSPEQTSVNEIYSGNNNININENVNVIEKRNEKISRDKKWGSLVIAGIPKYDISSAIIVTRCEKKIDNNGILVIEFFHPITDEQIQVPFEVGDEYVEPETRRVFVIFVDTRGRTLLIFKGMDRSVSATQWPLDNLLSAENNINENTNDNVIEKYQKLSKQKNWGSIVIYGVPKYDISSAMLIEKTVKKIGEDGIMILEFQHPVSGQKIRVPLNGGDEYVNPKTLRVYIIFVDIRGQTLLIFKGMDRSVPETQWPSDNVLPAENNINENTNENVIEKYKQISKRKNWGSIVIDGLPKYDILRAILIEKTVKKIGEDGITMLEFEHPVSGRKIRVPLSVGDEYVNPKTLRVYIIFVDIRGQTLLIFKGMDRSVPATQWPSDNVLPAENNINENTNENVIEKYKQISKRKNWGSIVIDGLPKYDILRAILIEKTVKKIGEDGITMLECEHPVSGRKIRVPLSVGDEYVNPKTLRVYIIFVDIRGQTLLIFKGMDRSVPATQWPSDNVLPAENNINENTNENVIEKYKQISKRKNWGSIVIDGLPKYDILRAILIEKTVKKIGEDGITMLEFEHPVSGRKIRVPLSGGDEYVNPKTLRVYIIFVDIRGRTLLIFKGMDRSVSAPQWPSNNVLPAENNINENTNENVIEKYKQISKRKNWGSIVIDGLPKYDILRAILIEKTVKKIGEDGITMLEFEHPVSGRKIRVPLSGGDEYVNPKTLRVYIIFVDIRGRTLLIFKGMDRSVSAPQWPSNNVLPPTGNNIDDNTNEKVIEKYEEISKQKNWGSIVIDGVPKYDISSALVVTKTVEKIGEDGISKIEFLHPITGQKIQIPLRGGDEYVKPGTSQVFVIFVDVQGRTLLIFKGTNRSIASTTSPNDDMSYEMNNVNNNTNVNVIVEKYREMTRQKNWGSLVVDGIPNYDISSAIFVTETKKKYGKDGILMIQFNHPITRERIFVPWRGGDEYVKPITGQVYVIFVDVEDRTLLIFKGERRSMRDKPSIESVTSFDETTDRTIEEVESSKIDNSLGANERGSIVVNGYPRYDISRAIYVTITKKIVSIDGISMLEFEHPVTGWKIRVSPRGGDEYVEPKTRRVFVIFVDTQGRTILILRDKNSSLAPQDSRFDKTRYGIIDREKKSGTIVVNGFPEYDVSRAIYVMKKMEKINNYGIRVIEFVHPITLEKIEINGNKADEYVEPGTQRLFIIFVDVQGRTLLIFKGFGSEIASKEPATIIDDDDNHSAENINVNRNINENVVMPRS